MTKYYSIQDAVDHIEELYDQVFHLEQDVAILVQNLETLREYANNLEEENKQLKQYIYGQGADCNEIGIHNFDDED